MRSGGAGCAKLLTLALAVLLIWSLPAVSSAKTEMLARIYPESKDHIENLVRNVARLGLDIATVKAGSYVEIVTTPEEVRYLTTELGLEVEVLIPDLAAHRRELFDGSEIDFGPYYTFDEMVEALDLIHAAYPEITTPKINIGTSWEGRVLWAMKVSDDPTYEDPDEPELLFDGVHHAREPIGCSICIYTIEYLTENYGVNPDITEMVNTREVWFVPVVNPDGYVYNETYSSGMWRKNRRDNGGGSFGVDPNRNYGYMWGYDNLGSSPDPWDETYRGPEAFSEPEIQAMRDFHEAHEFTFCQDYHSYGDLCLMPFGYDYVYTPDHEIYVELADSLTRVNNYDAGTCWELLYLVNGGSIDWEYGEQTTKPKCFGFSHEVGSAFWQPDTNTILGQFQENLGAELFMIRVAGSVELSYNGHIIDDTFGGDGNQRLDPGESGDLIMSLRNSGMAGAQNVEATITESDPYLDIIDGTAGFGDIPAIGTANNASDPFVIETAPATPVPYTASVVVDISAGNDETWTDTLVVWIVASGFADDMEGGAGDWTHEVVTSGFNDEWHVSSERNHTPAGTYSWKCGDTGTGPYSNFDDAGLMTAPFGLDLNSTLTMWHWVEAETSSSYPGRAYDGGLVEITTDGGAHWEEITPEGGYPYTSRGTTGPFVVGTPLYSGAYDWSEAVFDLSGYAGAVRLRFRFGSDQGVTFEGWHVDDVDVSAPAVATIELVPDATIVPRGGTLSYTATLTNCTSQTLSIYARTYVKLPGGGTIYLLGPVPVTLQPSQVRVVPVSHDVPLMAPLGEYRYTAQIGTPPNNLIDQDSYFFTVVEP